MITPSAIFNIKTSNEFEALALAVFKFQFEHNSVYRSFCDLLYKHPSDVKQTQDIPFLPIQFFKSHKIVANPKAIEAIFTSSGTTGSTTSKHFVTNLQVYQQSFTNGFEQFYGTIKDYAVLALLPSYLERKGSSLIYMVNDLIAQSQHPKSGFFLHNYSQLKDTLLQLERQQHKTLLIGVSFALLEFVEQFQLNLKHTIVMETGGMKGKRKELTRQELHNKLKKGFGVPHIHSEYGMTELLSQAYSIGKGVFKTPPWMQVLIRDTEDALSLLPHQKTGGINIIDLANINSCAFIATQDLGKIYVNNTFEVLGRFDHADIRGCNLLL